MKVFDTSKLTGEQASTVRLLESHYDFNYRGPLVPIEVKDLSPQGWGGITYFDGRKCWVEIDDDWSLADWFGVVRHEMGHAIAWSLPWTLRTDQIHPIVGAPSWGAINEAFPTFLSKAFSDDDKGQSDVWPITRRQAWKLRELLQPGGKRPYWLTRRGWK